MRHLRHALRGLMRKPGFALLAIVAMAIGIGANTAVFSVAYAVLLKSLPYSSPDELVFVTEVRTGTANSANVAPANYSDFRQARSFAAIGAAEMWGATLGGFDAPEQISGLRLTASVFQVLGVPPALGRVFRDEEERPGNHRVVVLTHALWMSRFGGDRGLIGRSINLAGEPWEVVGVMPPEFRFAPFWATNAQMFVPLSFTDAQRASRGARTLRVFGRLRPGVTPGQSVQELKTLFVPAPENARLEPWVAPSNEMVTGKVRTPILVLLGAVGLVLLIACANVATLLLVRALGKRREFAVRLSLGATRWELLRLSFTESAVLAAAGAALGLLAASAGIEALSQWFSNAMPRHEEIGISTPVVWFTVGLTMCTAAVLSLITAIQLPFRDVQEVLKESSRSVGASPWSNRARRLLVAGQVAMSLLLLVTAGLLTRSLVAMQSIDPGFRTEGVRTGVMHAWGTGVADPVRQIAFYQSVEERLRAAGPAGLINHLPLAGDVWTLPLEVEGRPAPAPGDRLGAAYRVATPGYFEAMGIRASRGRLLAETDGRGAPLVVVVNEALARQIWPGEEAVGKRIRVDGGEFLTVCGVVGDVVQRDWIGPRAPEVYLPLAQHPEAIGQRFNSSMTAVVRGSADIRATAASVFDAVPVSALQSMEEVVAAATQRSRVYAGLLGVFAASALLLALIGIYGLVSSDVNRRTQEIGVRAALGARPSDITRMVLRESLSLAAAGAVVGVMGALAVSRFLESMLYHVKPTDAATIAAALLLFAAVTALAAGLPARRASRLDPVRALRSE